MNTKLTSVKTFVQKHKTPVVATLGVVAGASITYYTCISGRTLLEVHAAHVESMRETGASLLYETTHGDLMLTVIPNS